MIPKSIAHTWSVLSPSCSNFSFWFGTSVFVDSFCLALHTRLCHSHELHFVLRNTDQTPPLHESFQQRIAVNQCYVFALCQVPASCQGPQFHFFSHSPWTRPLPQQATPSCLAGEMINSPSRICERLFDWFGFINQVLGSMIRGMDYHRNVYRTPQVMSIYFMTSA